MEVHKNGHEAAEGRQEIVEEILDEIADLEEYAKRGEKPPRCRGYRIRVNKDRIEIKIPAPTARHILEAAGLPSNGTWTLRIKRKGNSLERIDLDETVDLTAPGVEKFKAIPREQTEGAA